MIDVQALQKKKEPMLLRGKEPGAVVAEERDNTFPEEGGSR